MNNLTKSINYAGHFGKREILLPLSIKTVSSTKNLSDDIRFLSPSDTTSLKRGRGGRSSFSGKVATVFGASGFVGHYLCNRLGATGTQMILPYRGDFYRVKDLKLFGDLGQILFIPFDVNNEDTIRKAVKYSSVAINLVGRQWETRNFSFKQANADTARRIAKICKESGVEKFIHVSALNCNVDHPGYLFSGGSKFLQSKYESEMAVREEFPEATIFRPSDVWGRYDHFLSYYLSAYRYNFQSIGLPYNGVGVWKQPVYVGDLAQAICKVMFDNSAAGKIFEAIGPRRYELCELIDWFHRVTRSDKYVRKDMMYTPFTLFTAKLNEFLKYPRSCVTLDKIERDAVSDVISGLPKLGDLGVNLTKMEDRIQWELRTFDSYGYYTDEVGEYEKPFPPKFVELRSA